LFNICLCTHFHPQRLSDRALEWLGVTHGRPQLEFGVARCPELQQGIFAAVVEIDPRDRL